MLPRVAIILHGPPGTGKTTIAREIGRRLPGLTKHAILDHYWGDGEARFVGGDSRYADLRDAKEPVVIVEIGCGEPMDLSFNGATRAAHEWVNVLRDSDRELFPFRLWAEYDHIVQRLLDRQKVDSLKLFSIVYFIGLYTLYERGDPIATFPAIPNFQEQQLVTSGRPEAEVVDEIMAAARLS